MKKLVLLLLLVLPISIFYSQEKPNIIMIFVDDLGYGEISIYGQKKFSTPNIDAMAKKGMMFTNFYAGSTVCAPSRTSLLTGKHTGNTAIRGNKEIYPEGQSPLPQGLPTVASILKQKGYQTAAFGKWGLGFATSEGNPNWKGFDEFFGYICQRQAHDYFPEHLWHNQTKVFFPENKTADATYSAAVIHQKAMEYIDKLDKEKPFFIYLPYTLPHGDVLVPRTKVYWDFVEKFGEPPLQGDKLKKNAHNATAEPYPHAAFATMITTLDTYVGEIIKAIEDKGIAEKTLIIFTSDNGPHRENGGDPEFFNSSAGFRGIKRDLYEGGIREPFIAYMPSKIKPSVENEYYALWDMFPTFLDLAGIDYKKYEVDGISIKPLLFGKKQKEKHDYLYWEFHEMGGKQALRYGKWKGVRLNVNKGNEEIELYDLEQDPAEKNNLAQQYPEMVSKIKELMNSARKSDPNWPLFPSEFK